MQRDGLLNGRPRRLGVFIAWAVLAGSALPAPAGWLRHVEPTWGAAWWMPPGDVVKAVPAGHGDVQGVLFVLSPPMARSELAGVEPPDLQIRFYPQGAAADLAAWLGARGLLTEADVTWQGALQARRCTRTLEAPGCATYLWGPHRVAQLVALGAEGQAVMATFEWLPP